jgi:hypothetical protein
VYIINIVKQNQFPKKKKLGFENHWLIPIYERPWHGHPKKTKSIGAILAKSNTFNKVMLFDKECW